MAEIYDLIADQDLYFYDADAEIPVLFEKADSNGIATPVVNNHEACPSTPTDIFNVVESQVIEWEYGLSPVRDSDSPVPPKFLKYNWIHVAFGIASLLLTILVAKWILMRKKKRIPINVIDMQYQDVKSAIGLLKSEDYISELWINTDSVILRIRSIVNGLRATTKTLINTEGDIMDGIDLLDVQKCICEVSTLLEALLGDGHGGEGGLHATRACDIDEKILLLDIINRLTDEKDRLLVCKNCIDLMISTQKRVLSNLQRDTRALCNVSTVLVSCIHPYNIYNSMT
jgi:hypothetical protein